NRRSCLVTTLQPAGINRPQFGAAYATIRNAEHDFRTDWYDVSKRKYIPLDSWPYKKRELSEPVDARVVEAAKDSGWTARLEGYGRPIEPLANQWADWASTKTLFNVVLTDRDARKFVKADQAGQLKLLNHWFNRLFSFADYSLHNVVNNLP